MLVQLQPTLPKKNKEFPLARDLTEKEWARMSIEAIAEALTDGFEEVAEEPCFACGEGGDSLPCVACDRPICSECGIETRWCAECWDKRQESL